MKIHFTLTGAELGARVRLEGVKSLLVEVAGHSACIEKALLTHPSSRSPSLFLLNGAL